MTKVNIYLIKSKFHLIFFICIIYSFLFYFYFPPQTTSQFEDYWPSMQQAISKLLQQEDVSKLKCQELFWNMHVILQWDEKAKANIQDALPRDVLEFIPEAQATVLSHHDDQSFNTKNFINEENIVRKLMHNSWNEKIFTNIKHRLQDSAVKLVPALNDTGVRVLRTNNKDLILWESLNLMFRWLDRIEEGEEPILNHLEEHIVHRGLADISLILILFTKYGTLVKEAFNDDPRFLTGRDKAFKQVVNDTSKAKANIQDALPRDVLEFIPEAQATVLSHHDDQSLLKAYVAMYNSWNENIFTNIKNRLQDSAVKLVHAERNGEAFDSQLVIGVRESFVNLGSNANDVTIYMENFEKAYIESTEAFIISKVQQPMNKLNFSSLNSS
uniref:Cullin-5 n=1 Tax=Tetranychus urticae TaxID=32264 RepID=T1K5U8_TETUR